MKKSCPVIGRSWRDLVSKVNGDEDLAYALYFKYGDDVYDMTTEDLAPFTGAQVIKGVIDDQDTPITQDNNSYYRGQIEKPFIDEDGNLILFAREDELYQRAGLKSYGVSMSDNLQTALEYGDGQLRVAQNLLYEKFKYDINSWEAENAYNELLDNGYWLVQIPKSISNEIVQEAGEVKIINDIVVPKGQYKIQQFLDNEEQAPDISFKPKPLNTLSHLKQTEFKSSIRVGDEVNFPYWDVS